MSDDKIHIAYTYIEKLVYQGFSANEIQRALKGTPFAMRRETLQSIVRDIKDVQKKTESWKYTPKKYLPPKESVKDYPGILSTEYVYHFNVKGIDLRTGKEFEKPFSFGTDEFLATGTVSNRLEEALRGNPSLYEKHIGTTDYRITLIEYKNAWHRV